MSLRHMPVNNIVDVTATNENTAFPADRMLNEKPGRPYKTEPYVTTAEVVADIIGGVSDLLLAGTNASEITVKVDNPNKLALGSGVFFGKSDVGLMNSNSQMLDYYDGINLVGVFVYDPKLDSDGGVYAASKGITSVHYGVVLSTTIKLYKLTGAMPSLVSSFTTPTSCRVVAKKAINGKVALGKDQTSTVAKVFIVDLFTGAISEITGSSVPAIDATAVYVNSVSLGLIQNPAIAKDTGLGVPTIIVGTDVGLSVINGPAGENTCINTASSPGIMTCSFDSYNRIAAYHSAPDGLIKLYSTYDVEDFIHDTEFTPYPTTTPIDIDDDAVGCTNGLMKLFVPASKDPLIDILYRQMSALITPTFNTGLMFGDCKRALICEAKGITETLAGGLVFDRSPNAEAMTVNGSLTRSPVVTGADLQCISGFSTSNYLSQAYSSDLDFGTGDFYVMGWFNPTIFGNSFLLDKHDGLTTINRLHTVKLSSGLLAFRCGNELVTSTQNIDTSKFSFIVSQRRNGLIGIWIDGILSCDLLSSSSSLTNINHLLTIGISRSLAEPANKIALIRLGLGSLSDEKIAEIYKYEHHLFNENNKCTLYGTEDEVSKVSSDRLKNLIYASTSQGISIFQGISRVGTSGLGSIHDVSSNNGVFVQASTDTATVNVPSTYTQEDYIFIADFDEGAVGYEVSYDTESLTSWIHLNAEIQVPVKVRMFCKSKDGNVLKIGVLTGSIAETYGDRAPGFGMRLSGQDKSIEDENSNGSFYYKKRNIPRTRSVSIWMTHEKANLLENTFRKYGKAPAAFKLVDNNDKNLVMWGRMMNYPDISRDHETHSLVTFDILEVL